MANESPAAVIVNETGDQIADVQNNRLLTDTTVSGEVHVVDGGGSITVDGPLTDTELRASAVPVSTASLPLPAGAATESTLAAIDTKLGASLAVTGPLTDTELRATPVPVSGTVSVNEPVSIDDNGGSLTVDGPLTDTELRASAVPVSAASLPLPAGAATEATLATRATETTLNTFRTDFNNTDFATQTTLLGVDTKLATIDGVLDSIKDTDGIKKITDSLPAGTNEIGAVAQGTKALTANAWPIVQVDSAGNYASITSDAGVYRQEISGKVTVVGATPPPATTAAEIFADTPLTVGSHDTTLVIPTGEIFYLQNLTAGNEDPTKGAVITILFDDGTEHVIARVYTNGQTISIGYTDLGAARDGTSLAGNGTNTIIVRREKYSGTNIAIDAVVTGYTH